MIRQKVVHFFTDRDSGTHFVILDQNLYFILVEQTHRIHRPNEFS